MSVVDSSFEGVERKEGWISRIVKGKDSKRKAYRKCNARIISFIPLTHIERRIAYFYRKRKHFKPYSIGNLYHIQGVPE